MNTPAITPQQKRLEAGEIVRVRTRTYLVESVQPSPGTGTLVRMACLDDDAQGQPLEVVWELELEPEILDREAWQSIGKRGFDKARHFSAFIHTLRWNCVTATDARIFQAPFRVGIRHDEADKIAAEIEGANLDADKRATAEEELETAREHRKLQQQIDLLRNRINDASKWIGLDMDQLRDTLSCSLELLGAEPLKQCGAGVPPAGSGGIVQCGVGVSPASSGGILPPESRLVAPNSPAVGDTGYTGPTRYVFPNLDTRHGADPSWSATLDTLRALPEDGQTGYQWRKESPIRPVVFTAPEGIDDEIVQLHLQHRVVQRLLGRFLAQGFVHHDLSRACLAHTSDAIPRVVLLGRLSLYGTGAVRLHEEILTVTARWTEPASRRGTLAPYAREAEARTIELLESSLRPGAHANVPEVIAGRLQAAMPRDIEELLPHLERRGQEAQAEAEAKLKKRGDDEAESIRRVLDDQKRRVLTELGRYDQTQLLLSLDLEKRQLEANRRYWDKWLTNVEGDLKREPDRVRQFYQVASFRIEPVGLAYLWPVTG